MRVLFVCPFVPWPLDSGGRIRTWHLARTSAKHVELELWVVREPGAGEAALKRLDDLDARVRVFERGAPGFFERLALPKIERWFWSTELTRALRERMSARDVDLVHLDELLLARRLPTPCSVPVAQHHHKLDTVLHRRLLTGVSAAARFDLWKLEHLEREATRRTRTHLTCSAGDAELLRSRYPDLATWEIPSGYDPSAFAPTGVERDRARLVYVGSMDYPPNIDALRWFAAESWPALRRAKPDLRLDVVGRDPVPEVRALAGDGIEVHGAVDDVRPWMERAGAMVVPLRIGGGTRLKIVEALALATPTVSTTIGAEGLGLRDGRELRLADNAESIVAATLDILGDADADSIFRR